MDNLKNEIVSSQILIEDSLKKYNVIKHEVVDEIILSIYRNHVNYKIELKNDGQDVEKFIDKIINDFIKSAEYYRDLKTEELKELNNKTFDLEDDIIRKLMYNNNIKSITRMEYDHKEIEKNDNQEINVSFVNGEKIHLFIKNKENKNLKIELNTQFEVERELYDNEKQAILYLENKGFSVHVIKIMKHIYNFEYKGIEFVKQFPINNEESVKTHIEICSGIYNHKKAILNTDYSTAQLYKLNLTHLDNEELTHILDGLKNNQNVDYVKEIYYIGNTATFQLKLKDSETITFKRSA